MATEKADLIFLKFMMSGGEFSEAVRKDVRLAIRELEARRLVHVATQNKPAEPGHYWFRWDLDGPWHTVRVFKDQTSGITVQMDGFCLPEGEWAGPISEPISLKAEAS